MNLGDKVRIRPGAWPRHEGKTGVIERIDKLAGEPYYAIRFPGPTHHVWARERHMVLVERAEAEVVG